MLSVNKKIMFSFILILSFQSIAVAEPTKKETAKFITEKANDYILGECSGKQGEYKISFKNNFCTLIKEYVVHVDGTGTICKNNKVFNHEIITVNLKDIDPERTTKDSKYGSVEIYVKNDEKKIIFKRINYEGKLIKSIEYSTVIPTHEEKASINTLKLAKALNHLTRLCGGTGELF